VRFRYFDPLQQSTVEGSVHSAADVAELVEIVAALRAGPAPAVEFVGHEGTSLMLGIAAERERAVLLWTDAQGHTLHTVDVAASGPDRPGPGVIFDYFGSYTELPGEYGVALSIALEAAGRYVETGQAPALALASDT
jgi:hypothetical protein